MTASLSPWAGQGARVLTTGAPASRPSAAADDREPTLRAELQRGYPRALADASGSRGACQFPCPAGQRSPQLAHGHYPARRSYCAGCGPTDPAGPLRVALPYHCRGHKESPIGGVLGRAYSAFCARLR
jgi:hypothetical protein